MGKETLKIQFWKKQLVIYFLKHYKLFRESAEGRDIYSGTEDFFMILTQELQKPMNNHFIPKNQNGSKNLRSMKRKNVFVSFFINDLIMHRSKDERNPSIIYNYLQKIEGFKEFCYFNHIGEDAIRSAIPFMTYEKIEKGSFIIKKGESWKKFFCIMRGRILVKFRNDLLDPNENFMFFNPLLTGENVNLNDLEESNMEKLKEIVQGKNYNKSLTSLKKPGIMNVDNQINKEEHKAKKYDENLNEKKLSFFEENKLREIILKNESLKNQEKIDFPLEAGKCFGDYPIINNQQSAFSLIASEETHLIGIDSGIFGELFSKFILKAENDRKIFFKSCLDIFKESHRFEEYYQRVSLVCARKNQLIYKEKNEGHFIYLINYGNFALEKECKKELEFLFQEKHDKDKASRQKLHRSQSHKMSLVPNSGISFTFKTPNKSHRNSIDMKSNQNNNDNNQNKYSSNSNSNTSLPSNHNVNFLINFKQDNYLRGNLHDERTLQGKMNNENFEFKYKSGEKNLTVMNLVKGAYAGLEILFDREAAKYNHSFKATGPLNFLYKINLDCFPEMNKEILDFLNPIYKKQKSILKSLLKKNLSVKIQMDDVFEKSHKNNQDIMLGKIAKDLRTTVIQKEKQKNELKNIVNRFSKKYVLTQNKFEDFSTQENNNFNNWKYDNYKNEGEVVNNVESIYNCIPNVKESSQACCNYVTENTNKSEMLSEKKNYRSNELISSDDNINEANKINCYREKRRNHKFNSFSYGNGYNNHHDNQNQDFMNNNIISGTEKNKNNELVSANHFKNSLLDTTINSQVARGERRSSSFNLRSFKSKNSNLIQSLNNFNIPNSNTIGNQTSNQNNNSNNDQTFNDPKMKVKQFITEEKSSIKNSSDTNCFKNTDPKFHIPIVVRNIKTSEAGTVLIRKTNQINSNLILNNNNNSNNSHNKNTFDRLLDLDSIPNKNFESKGTSTFKSSIFTKINGVNKNLSSSLVKNLSTSKIKIKSEGKNKMNNEIFSNPISKNNDNFFGAIKDRERPGSSVFIEFNKKHEKPLFNHKMKFSMDDVFDHVRNQNEKANENAKITNLRDINVRTPIRNCILNWKKINFDAEVNEVNTNKNNNKIIENDNYGSTNLTKNFNEIKMEPNGKNGSCSNSPLKKNKNFNLFRTSFFNLPLISSLSTKK